MNQAFSLPELVAVIVIIGILATLGVHQYRSFIANGRQAEAKLNLKAIADLQESYKYAKEKCNELAEANGVGAFSSDQCSGSTPGEKMKNELGFRPTNCKKLRYGYWWTKGTASQHYADARAYAESTTRDDKLIYPGCKKEDKWILKTKIKEMVQGDNDTERRANSAIQQCE